MAPKTPLRYIYFCCRSKMSFIKINFFYSWVSFFVMSSKQKQLISKKFNVLFVCFIFWLYIAYVNVNFWCLNMRGKKSFNFPIEFSFSSFSFVCKFFFFYCLRWKILFLYVFGKFPEHLTIKFNMIAFYRCNMEQCIKKRYINIFLKENLLH